MFLVEVLLMVIPVIALARRTARSITVTVWIVGSAYAILGLGIAVLLLIHGHPVGLAALACGLSAAAGTLVHRRRPVLATGLLMTGALVIAAGWVLIVVAFAVGWGGGGSLSSLIALVLYEALPVIVPALLTGIALILGPKRLQEKALL